MRNAPDKRKQKRFNGVKLNPSTIVPTYGAGGAPTAGSTLRFDKNDRDVRAERA